VSILPTAINRAARLLSCSVSGDLADILSASSTRSPALD
jgi:hypothetical protein